MTINFKQRKDELLFLPLGGSAEIGMNFNLYHYKGKWLIADCGAGFAEDFMPGIDMIVPDIRFIVEHRKDIVGMVITHAHEDHVGAVPYLWNELRCPVYASPFTAAFLKAKLTDFGLKQDVDIREVECGSKFSVGDFSLEFVGITHSVPEMNGLIINTPYGAVVHTGDWKIDPRPMVGPATDEAKLEKFGKQGVLAMVCDSTNVFKEAPSGSEGDLRDSLIKLIGECDKMVAVTTFASNVARIETVARAAEASGRKMAMAGRSLWRIYRAAKECGYLKDLPPILEEHQIHKYARHQIVVMCTGCQGEPMAAMNKIAQGMHANIRLSPGDTVIFSSKIIPGNDKRIFRLFNKLVLQGVEVLTERDHFVHVSGHPSRSELAHMYQMVKPKIAIPVHGEHVHMHEHVRLAKVWGVEHALQTKNGDVMKLAPGVPEKIGEVNSGYFGIDGHLLLAPDCEILRMRRRMQKEGLVMVTLILDKGEKRLRQKPIVSAPGALDREHDADILDAISDEVDRVLSQSFSQGKIKNLQETLINHTRSAAKRVMKRDVNKTPMVEVHIVRE